MTSILKIVSRSAGVLRMSIYKIYFAAEWQKYQFQNVLEHFYDIQ